MRRKTRTRLVAVIVVAIVIVAAAWYATRRGGPTQYLKLTTLQNITFTPPPLSSGATCTGALCAKAPPILAFTFSGAVEPADVLGGTAVLKSFAIDPSTPPATAAAAAKVVGALLTKGGVPFAPVLRPPATVTTNAMPAALLGAGIPAITFTGVGEMWFTRSL